MAILLKLGYIDITITSIQRYSDILISLVSCLLLVNLPGKKCAENMPKNFFVKLKMPGELLFLVSNYQKKSIFIVGRFFFACWFFLFHICISSCVSDCVDNGFLVVVLDWGTGW